MPWSLSLLVSNAVGSTSIQQHYVTKLYRLFSSLGKGRAGQVTLTLLKNEPNSKI